ncbi:MAG: hypothetical protein FWE04_06695 [Oscillospiraceae bacterium]|nr:hypothetical protein [Oscillospiraceae bacterium]
MSPPDPPPPPSSPRIVSTSPNGNYRLEVASMDIRDGRWHVVDSTTDELKLVIEEIFYGGVIGWSPNSRFAVIETHSTFYVDTIVVDTNDFSSIRLSIKDDFDLFSNHFPYEHAPNEHYLMFVEWVDDSIMQMRFVTGIGPHHGTFHYNAVNGRVSNFEYHEGWGH